MSKTFPLVRGRKMRVTRLDGCGKPVYGKCSLVVTEGFISVALSAQINEGEAITVTTASGKTCVNDQPTPEFQGYTAELTFCNVDPDLFALITGQETVLDNNGQAVGFRMSSDVDLAGSGFALELWAGVPGVACDDNAVGGDPSGYLLLPFLKGGVLGDFTIENAAITFGITGAATKGGSGWGVGPYDVVDGAGGAEPLAKPIGSGDHLHVQFTQVSPPADTDGCYPLLDPNAGAALSGPPTVTDDGGFKVTLTLNGTDTVTDQTPILVTWGDGTWSYITAAANLTHTYPAAGTYSVILERAGAGVGATATVA